MGKFFDTRVGKAVRQIGAVDISTYAASACYFMVLALFPTLVLILGLFRYTSLQPGDLMDFLQDFLPEALHAYTWKLISSAYNNTSKLVVSLSALAALWSSSKGIYGLVKGLNAVYDVQERRTWLRTRCMCVFYMVLLLVVLMLTLVLHVFGSTLVQFLRSTGNPQFWVWLDLMHIRFFVLVAMQTLLFCAMFMYLPDCDNGFRESLPGALLASLGWMGASSLFSVYVRNFPSYANIFGSVYIAALAVLWLYVCISIIFYGAVLNRLLKEMR